ncbi:hypothetical protein CR513_33623, partial [Mucuna pruriens]
MKVELVTLEFNDYALVWWNQALYDIRRTRRPPYETSTELKRNLKDRIDSFLYKDPFAAYGLFNREAKILLDYDYNFSTRLST